MATEPLVLVHTEDRIATLTLNRPKARNALSRALMYALWDGVKAAGDDPGERQSLNVGSRFAGPDAENRPRSPAERGCGKKQGNGVDHRVLEATAEQTVNRRADQREHRNYPEM